MEIGIAACLLFGALAIVGAEARRPRLVVVGKPLATLSLLLVLGAPGGAYQRLVALGILLSVVGDVALIGESDRAFLVGTVSFLIAHVCYILAFAKGLGGGGPGPLLAWPSLAVAACSTTLVVLLWRNGGAMRPAIVVYAATITVMLSTAFAAAAASSSRAFGLCISAGAVLFYVSDASLAWNRFRAPYRHSALLILATYWIGQIGIALGARIHG